MEIKKVVQLLPALQLAKKDRIVEMAFVFGPSTPDGMTMPELEQRYELDAKTLLDFMRTLPSGTVTELLKLIDNGLLF